MRYLDGDRNRRRHGPCRRQQPITQGAKASTAMGKSALPNHRTVGIQQGRLVRLGCPIDAYKPSQIIISHVLPLSMIGGPPRRLPIPVLALEGATPHRASIAANPLGHLSPQVLEAQGGKGRSQRAGPYQSV